mgnify:CR=1 FL=1
MSTPSVCPVRGVCLSPGPCANAAGCILQTTPGANALALPNFPYPLRRDDKPRITFPQGVEA